MGEEMKGGEKGRGGGGQCNWGQKVWVSSHPKIGEAPPEYDDQDSHDNGAQDDAHEDGLDGGGGIAVGRALPEIAHHAFQAEKNM